MAQDQRQFLDRLLPPEDRSPRRAVWLSFGLWPLAVLLLLHGLAWGLSSLGMLVVPLCLIAFRRIADLFPRATPGRRVIVGFSSLYAVAVIVVALSQSTGVGLVLMAAIAAATVRALLRPTDQGAPAIQAAGERSRVEWEVEQALTSGADGDDGPGDTGLGPMPRFHWPEI